MGMVSYTLSARTLHYQYVIVMDCNKDMLSAEENKRYWAGCVRTTTTTKIPMRSFYTFLSDEELSLIQEHLTHEQKKRSIIKQKHILEEELQKQETMQERVVVREELRRICEQIKKYIEKGKRDG